MSRTTSTTARVARSTTTRVARTTTTAVGATTSGSDAAVTPPSSERCAALADEARDTPRPTFPGGRIATSTEHRVSASYPATWRVDQVTVTPGQVLAPLLVQRIGLAKEAVLRPLAMRDPSQFPGVAVFRLGRARSDLAEVISAARTDLRDRGFAVREGVLTGCMDDEPTAGLIATNPTALQVVWYAFHREELYLVLCLGSHDGLARSQGELLSQFQLVLQTIRFAD